MASSKVTVIAQLKAKPGQEQQLRKELLALIAPTRAEAGCLNYDLHQTTDDPAVFLFHENWTSVKHLNAHLKKPHLTALLAKADQLLAAPPQITLWKEISPHGKD